MIEYQFKHINSLFNPIRTLNSDVQLSMTIAFLSQQQCSRLPCLKLPSKNKSVFFYLKIITILLTQKTL